MWIRMFPGLLVALALGVFLCRDELPPTADIGSGLHRVSARARDAARLLLGEDVDRPAAVASVNAAPATRTPAPRPVNTTSGIFRRQYFAGHHIPDAPRDRAVASAFESQPLRLPPPPAAARLPAGVVARPNDLTGSPTGEPAPPSPSPSRRDAPASSTALASLFRRSGTSPWMTEDARYPAPTTRGYDRPKPRDMYAWAETETFREKQKARDLGLSRYEHKGNIHRVGLNQDWSIDSVAGVSFEYLDGGMKSGHRLDNRKNDIKGYFGNLHYESVLFGRFLLNLQATAGRIETRGSGRYGGDDGAGGVVHRDWREDKHSANLYGASARLGFPELVKGEYRLLTEIGVDYRSLHAKSYEAGIDGLRLMRVPKSTATSLAIPVLATVKRDFMPWWGLVTPRLDFGMTFELKDDAARVRNFQASAAAFYYYDPVTGFRSSRLERDSGQKVFYHVGAGLDVKTIAGWNLAAGVAFHAGEEYRKTLIKLELGRCF